MEKTIEIILSQILNKGFDAFALRKDNTEYQIDESPRNSNHWYDFDWDNAKLLDGTCCTHINLEYCCDDEIEEMKEIISESIKINKDYMGSNWYILYGTEYEDGQDENEIILRDAKVLAKI